MTPEEQRCSNCERDLTCNECRHKDIIIPVKEKLDIRTIKRLRGETYNPATVDITSV